MSPLIHSLHDRVSAFAATTRGRRLLKVARVLVGVVILSVLTYQLSRIGWLEIWHSLPVQPLFYVILAAMYLLLPVSEAIVYRKLWGAPLGHTLPALLRKRVLNADVLGYSGEVYLYMWAKGRIRLPQGRIVATIKDSLIASSMASITAAVLLLALLVGTRQVDLGTFVENPSPYYLFGGLVVASLAIALAVRFRRAIFSLPKHTVAFIGSVHLARFVLGYVLQVLQWWVVIPDASFKTWAVLLVAFVVINRIPLLPSRDLLFISAGAELSLMLDVPVAPIVSMLIVRSAVDRLLNAGLFGATAVLRHNTDRSAVLGRHLPTSDIPEERPTAEPEIGVLLKS